MLLTKLKLNYFGKFVNYEMELKPGINLIYGDNEAGKSTIHTFIRGMFFGIERLRGRASSSKEDLYTRYLPWDYPGAFGGNMDIQVGDKNYRLQRSFHGNDKSFTVIDLVTGREIKLKEGFISELLPNLTASTFKNTISIEQLKAQTDTELAAQVRNYIANLSVTKSKEVDVEKATSILTHKKKQFDQTQTLTLLQALQNEIDEGLAKEAKIEELTSNLSQQLLEEQFLKKQKKELEASFDRDDILRMDQLPAIEEKFKSYLELSHQVEALEQQENLRKERIAALEKNYLSIEQLRGDIQSAQELTRRQLSLEKQLIELQRERMSNKQSGGKYLWISLFPSILVAFLILIISGFNFVGIILAVVFFMGGSLACFGMQRNHYKKQGSMEDDNVSLSMESKQLQDQLQQICIRNRVNKVEELSYLLEKILSNNYRMEQEKEEQRKAKQQLKTLEDQQDVLYEFIMKYMQYFVQAEELTVKSMENLRLVIRHLRQEQQDKLEEIQKQYEGCRLKIERLRWEIATIEDNEEQLVKNRQRYEELEEKRKNDEVELEAILLALSTIQELGAKIHDSFGQELNKAVSEVISEVTGEKYQDLKVDEKLEVKVGWKGEYVPLDRLSAGTVDQVYFALRLAVSDLLLGKDEVPLLLDDSFALYDDSRVKAALEKLAQRKQILLFTCHRREQMLLEEMELPYHFVDLTCR